MYGLRLFPLPHLPATVVVVARPTSPALSHRLQHQRKVMQIGRKTQSRLVGQGVRSDARATGTPPSPSAGCSHPHSMPHSCAAHTRRSNMTPECVCSNPLAARAPTCTACESTHGCISGRLALCGAVSQRLRIHMSARLLVHKLAHRSRVRLLPVCCSTLATSSTPSNARIPFQ